MECCIIRKVPYRLSGTNRLVWAVILAEREGLSLLFVQKPDDQRAHEIVIGIENVPERVFEVANACRFQVSHEDMAEIGGKFRALAEGLSEDEFRKFFRRDDSWND